MGRFQLLLEKWSSSSCTLAPSVDGRGRIQDTKQKARTSNSFSRAGTLVNPIFCTPDRKVHRNIITSFCPGSGLVLHLKVSGSKGMEQNRLMFDLATWTFTSRSGEGVTQVLELWNSLRSARTTLPSEISWVRSTSTFIVSIGYIRLFYVMSIDYAMSWLESTRSM